MRQSLVFKRCRLLTKMVSSIRSTVADFGIFEISRERSLYGMALDRRSRYGRAQPTHVRQLPILNMARLNIRPQRKLQANQFSTRPVLLLKVTSHVSLRSVLRSHALLLTILAGVISYEAVKILAEYSRLPRLGPQGLLPRLLRPSVAIFSAFVHFPARLPSTIIAVSILGPSLRLYSTPLILCIFPGVGAPMCLNAVFKTTP